MSPVFPAPNGTFRLYLALGYEKTRKLEDLFSPVAPQALLGGRELVEDGLLFAVFGAVRCHFCPSRRRPE